MVSLVQALCWLSVSIQRSQRGGALLSSWGVKGPVGFRRNLGGQMLHFALRPTTLVYLMSSSSDSLWLTAVAFKGQLWRTPLFGGVAPPDSDITDIQRTTSISFV